MEKHKLGLVDAVDDRIDEKLAANKAAFKELALIKAQALGA